MRAFFKPLAEPVSFGSFGSAIAPSPSGSELERRLAMRRRMICADDARETTLKLMGIEAAAGAGRPSFRDRKGRELAESVWSSIRESDVELSELDIEGLIAEKVRMLSELFKEKAKSSKRDRDDRDDRDDHPDGVDKGAGGTFGEEDDIYESTVNVLPLATRKILYPPPPPHTHTHTRTHTHTHTHTHTQTHTTTTTTPTGTPRLLTSGVQMASTLAGRHTTTLGATLGC